MKTMHEIPSSFGGTLPEAPDDLRVLEEQMPDVTNVFGKVPYQEASMHGDLPVQGTLEIPEPENPESLSGTIDLGELPTEAVTPEEDLEKGFSGSLGIESRLDSEPTAPAEHQSEQRPSRPVPETDYDKLPTDVANRYKDFRILAANPNTRAVTPDQKTEILRLAQQESLKRGFDTKVYRDPADPNQTPWRAVEYPTVLTLNGMLRGGYEDVSEVSQSVLSMAGDKSGSLTHVIIETEDGHDLILHKTTGPDKPSAKDQEFTLLTTKMLDAEGTPDTATPIKSNALKDIILVPGESISADFGLTEAQKSQLPSGRVTRIIGLSLDAPLASNHPRVSRPEYSLNLDSELLAVLPGAEEQIPPMQGTLDGAEGLLPPAESQQEPTIPEAVASDEAATAASNPQVPELPVPRPNQGTAPDESSPSGNLPPVVPYAKKWFRIPPTPPTPSAQKPETLSIPAEPAHRGLSARELNRLLDSDNPADRDLALKETRRQNQNDGTRIMTESLKDFTPVEVNNMSEQQIASISPKMARQMTRAARKRVGVWQDYYQRKRGEIANATPERFTFIRDNISRIYGRLTEGAKGAYQIRLVGDATPADLARINPSQLTTPDARRLYDERRRVLEGQGYRF